MNKFDSRRYYAKHKTEIQLRKRYRRRRNVAQAILEDARKSDRRFGRENDLDIAFVTALIADPCRYCGDEELRKTIDRIDNDFGHLRANVVFVCERCNYVRRNMPHAAWMIVAAAMREARIKSLFGTWTGAIHHREPLPALPLPANRQPKPHGTLARYSKCGPPRCELCRAAMAAWKRERRKTTGP